MDFEIFTYGNGDLLRYVFNAIASLFNSSGYLGVIKVVALIGCIVALARSAFEASVQNNLYWLLGVISFTLVALVPKVDVIINDRVAPSNSSVVANVPIGIAGTAGFFSFTGDYFSRAFETVFSLPSQANYTESGLLFAQKLFDESQRLTLSDGRTNANFYEFFSSCVVVDGIGHGRFTWDDLTRSSNLSNFFSNNVAQNAASFAYTASNGSQSILPCRSGYVDSLKPDIEDGYEDSIKYGLSGGMISRFNSKDVAAEKVENDMQGILAYLTGSSQTAQSTVVQMSIINAMTTGLNKLSQETSASEFNDYIITGAEIERMSTYQALGNIASEKLPLLRSIFECIIYAIFPIVVLLAILHPIKVSTAYVSALVWINLWAPTYAILHFIMTYYSAEGMKELAGLYGGGFSMLSSAKMISHNADAVATTGYLATSIPMLTWMLVSRSGAMAASMAGRLMQGYDSSVQSESKEVENGNMNRLGTNMQMTPQGTIQNKELLESGSTVTTTANGSTLLDQATSSTLVSPSSMSQVSQQTQRQYETSVQNTDQKRADLETANSSVLKNTSALMNEVSQRNSANDGYRSAETAQQQQNSQTLQSATNDWSKANGVTDTEEFNRALKGFLQADAKFGLKALELIGIKGGIGGGVGGEVSGSWKDASTETKQAVEKFVTSDQFTEAVSLIASGSQEFASQYGVSVSDGGQSGLDASLSEQQNAKEAYTVASMQTEKAAIAAMQAAQIQDALQINQGQALVDAMTQGGRSIQESDQLIRQAASGDAAAMDQIKWTIQNAGFQGVGSSEFNTLQDVRAALDGQGDFATALRNEGVQTVDTQSQDNNAVVDSEGASNMDYVDGFKPIQRGEAMDYINSVEGASKQQFDSPNANSSELSGVIRGEAENINKDGISLQEKVDDELDIDQELMDRLGDSSSRGALLSQVNELRNRH